MTKKILLAHGSGGKMSHDLVCKSLVQRLSNPTLDKMDDSAILELNGRTAFTTDSYVVSPIFFPGGDIGRLAVCGTVNDLAMSGASPLYLGLSLIIEEGLPFAELDKIIASVLKAAAEAGVKVVTGDTKVVNQGTADKLFINTSGLGVIPDGVNISGANAVPGDKVIISGTIGDHGMAIMSQREGLRFTIPIESDCAPLNSLVADMLAASANIHSLRDPTRGGLATTLNELADQSSVGIDLEEELIPINEAVRAACELLGFDPLYVANEGKLIAIVAPADAEAVLGAMRKNAYGGGSVIIGEVTDKHPGRVNMKTLLGASRIVDMLSGELLPRIC
ncbi:MAG: hydrogenase expression/formation protein HypE [Dehalococcoidales bacterium]